MSPRDHRHQIASVRAGAVKNNWSRFVRPVYGKLPTRWLTNLFWMIYMYLSSVGVLVLPSLLVSFMVMELV